MNERTFKLISIVLGMLFLTSVGLLILFGFRLAKVNKLKAGELDQLLSQQAAKLDEAYQADRERTTTKYVAEDVFGSFEFSYPKVWSTNVKRSSTSPELKFLADPNLIVMRDEQGPETALRLFIYRESFEDKVKSADGEIKTKKLAVTKESVTLSSLTGFKYKGKTKEKDNTTRAYVILPLRDKSLYIGTDNYDKYGKQFEAIINSFKISR